MVISNNRILQCHWAIYIFRFCNALSKKEFCPDDAGTSWLWSPTYSRLALLTSQHKNTVIEIEWFLLLLTGACPWPYNWWPMPLFARCHPTLSGVSMKFQVSPYTFMFLHAPIYLQVSACIYTSSGVCMHLYTFRCHYAPSDVSTHAESVNNCGL